MTEAFRRHYPTAREMLNMGLDPASLRPRDANFLLSSGASGRNLDASTVGKQKRRRSDIRVWRKGK